MAAAPLQISRTKSIRLSFAPDPASARAAAATVRSFLSEQGVTESELFAYELSIAEATYNAIDHAQGSARDLEPVVEALFTPEEIELRVIDHTAGFDLPERAAVPSPLAERGRGLFLIFSVMDEVRYLRGAKENILIMRKRRRALPAAPANPEPDSAPPAVPEDAQRQLAEAKRTMAGMARELSFRSETLSAIFRCCAELGRNDPLAEGFAERLLVDLLKLVSADWYVHRVYHRDKRQLTVASTSISGLRLEPLAIPATGSPAQGIETAVATSQTVARFDLREVLTPTEPLLAIGPKSAGLVCPLCFGGALVGTIAVGRYDGDSSLGKLQGEVVGTFAEFLAIQTVNLRSRNEDVRSRVVARELEIAKEIQHLLLPRTLPQLAGVGLTGGWQSAREVGGDFYDAFALSGHSLILMVADVMGKGVPAALFATTMRGLLRGMIARSNDPAELLSRLNRLLYAELSAVNMFITAQIVLVDLETRQVTTASAGHCPLLYVPPGRRTVAALATQGIPLGVLPDTVYRDETVPLGTPAALLLYTDGLTDTRDAEGAIFGQQRLVAWLRANLIPGRSASELRDRLMTELNRFRGDAAMADDQAFLLLTEEGVGPERVAAPGQRRLRIQRGAFLFPVNS